MSNSLRVKIEISLVLMLFGALALLCGCHCTTKTCTGKADKYKPAYLKYSRMTVEKRLENARSRRGAYYEIRLKRFLNEAPGVEKGGTVFLGDSHIQGFPLDKAFGGSNMANCGVSGDRIDGVAERLDVCVGAFQPSRVYLMIGINDLLRENAEPVARLAGRYHKLIRDLIYTAPGAEITVFSILPTAGGFAEKNALVYQLNDEIEAAAKKEGVEYFDLHPFITRSGGGLNPRFTTDGLHLNLNGYLCWMQAFLDSEVFLDAAMNLSEVWTWKHSGSFVITKIDPPADGEFPGNRGADELVIYTPKYAKPSTGTNEWGQEAIIRNGIVTDLSLHNSKIPADGFVVSGHGIGASWISNNLNKGFFVEFDSKTIKYKTTSESTMTIADRLDLLKTDLFELLAMKKDSGISREIKDKTLSILNSIRDMQSGEKQSSMAEIKRLAAEIKELGN